jgi:DNA repair exonuclease SbcCD nuclease subunit
VILSVILCIALAMLRGFSCYTVPTELASNHLFIPWYEDSQKVAKISKQKVMQKRNLTLFAHVGLNGVIPASIGNTLNPEDFDERFKYVFCGHFHNHVSFNSRVFSVGALTHQTWSDVGSKAGYLIVYEDKVEHFETSSPMFGEVLDGGSISFHNRYIRLRGIHTPEESAIIKKQILVGGALGVLDQTSRPTIIEKNHAEVVNVDLGIDAALESYCKHTFGDNWQKVFEECVKLKLKN